MPGHAAGVKDGVHAAAGRHRGRAVAQVGPDRLDAQGVQRRAASPAQGPHRVAAGPQLLDDVEAEESPGTGDQCIHGGNHPSAGLLLLVRREVVQRGDRIIGTDRRVGVAGFLGRLPAGRALRLGSGVRGGLRGGGRFRGRPALRGRRQALLRLGALAGVRLGALARVCLGNLVRGRAPWASALAGLSTTASAGLDSCGFEAVAVASAGAAGLPDFR